MWKVWREIFKGTTFYYKQMNLFLLLALLASAIFISIAYVPKYVAKVRLPGSIDASTLSSSGRNENSATNFDVVINQQGHVTVNGKTQRGLITFGQASDSFLLILAREPEEFIPSLKAVVHLPKEVVDPATIEPRIYAIHGVERSNYEIVNQRTIQFNAEAIYPGSEVSIGLKFPKNYFNLSPLGRFRSNLIVLPAESWILIGSLLPGLSALFLLYLIALRAFAKLRVRNKMPVNIAPSALPPAIIGALYHGHIGKKEITATLFDLAHRGFIAVHLGEDDEIIFAKGESLYSTKANTLRPYEIFLLHQIFGDEGFAAHSRSIKADLNSELFSSKIALTILNIYDATVAEGYFIKSPNSYFLKYRIVGLLLFFIALGALVYGAFTLPEPAFVLFLWFGMLLAAVLIIKITPGLPRRTRNGDRTLKQWLGFRNYLTAHQLVNAGNTSDFFQNLPYAIVMDCEREWIARWKDQPIRLPDWFTASQDLFTAEEFSKSVVGIIEFLAKHLIAARPPDLA